MCQSTPAAASSKFRKACRIPAAAFPETKVACRTPPAMFYKDYQTVIFLSLAIVFHSLVHWPFSTILILSYKATVGQI